MKKKSMNLIGYHEQIKSSLRNYSGKELTTKEIIKIINDSHPYIPNDSILPGDHSVVGNAAFICRCCETSERIFDRVRNDKGEIEEGRYIVRPSTTGHSIIRNSLVNKYNSGTPKQKARIVKIIERGPEGNYVKKYRNFKCQICEALNENPIGFKKRDGEYYVEAHHVEHVSTGNHGVLDISNIISVCANHHRQIHYGNVVLMSPPDSGGDFFEFNIDDKVISVEKFKFK